MNILGRFAQQLILPPNVPKKFSCQHGPISLRLQTHEFKSLACTLVRKLSPPVDQTLWKKFKVPLCSLLAQHSTELQKCHSPAAESDPSTHSPGGSSLPPATAKDAAPPASFSAVMQELLAAHFAPEDEKVQTLLASPLIPEPQKVAIAAKLAAKKKDVADKVLQWCCDTAVQPEFQVVQPILSQAMSVDADPAIEHAMRNGQDAEDLVYQLLHSELQAGWSLCSGAQILQVGGRPFVSKKFVKGEIDVLLLDPGGEVQAVVEVKTASGNPLLALYEDVVRLKALMDEICGQSVSVQLPDRSKRNLSFAPTARPVYVLACDMQPEGFAAAAESAYAKLLVTELGRLLSSQVATWRSVSIVETTPALVTLQLTDECLAELDAAVTSFFDSLGSFEIYSLKAVAQLGAQ